MIKNPESFLLQLSKEVNPIDSKNAVIFTAGNAGFDFFDIAKQTLSPKTSSDVVEIYMDLLGQIDKAGIKYNKLAFTDKTLGPLMLSSQLIQKTQKEALIIKTRFPCDCRLCSTKLRVKSSCDMDETPVKEQDRIVIVSDVLSTGGTIQKSIDIIQNYHGKVVAAVVIVDRQVFLKDEKSVKEVLEEKNKDFALFSFTTRDRMLAWGFSEPTMHDLEKKDFFEVIRSSLEISDNGQIKENETFVKKLVDYAIQERKDKDIRSDRKMLENMVVALLSHSFTKQAIRKDM
jgi:hypoxanthine phosphoribosyltransferase